MTIESIHTCTVCSSLIAVMGGDLEACIGGTPDCKWNTFSLHLLYEACIYSGYFLSLTASLEGKLDS